MLSAATLMQSVYARPSCFSHSDLRYSRHEKNKQQLGSRWNAVPVTGVLLLHFFLRFTVCISRGHFVLSNSDKPTLLLSILEYTFPLNLHISLFACISLGIRVFSVSHWVWSNMLSSEWSTLPMAVLSTSRATHYRCQGCSIVTGRHEHHIGITLLWRHALFSLLGLA